MLPALHSRDCDCPVCTPDPIGGGAIERLLLALIGLATAALAIRACAALI